MKLLVHCGSQNGPTIMAALEGDKKERLMDNVDLVRLVAGILFLVVLFVLIQRRRKRVH